MEIECNEEFDLMENCVENQREVIDDGNLEKLKSSDGKIE